VRWNGEAVPSPAALESKFHAAVKQPIQPEIHLRPNRLAAYRSVAAVMASAQRAGIAKIGLIGNEQFAQ
jgi:biopolymer transport protein ExbD